MRTRAGFRWLTYREWERVGRRPVGIAVSVVEIVIGVALVLAFLGKAWVGLVLLAILGVEYLGWCVAVGRTEGPAAAPRRPARWLTLGEWWARAKERFGLYVLAGITVGTCVLDFGAGALVLVPVLALGDYLWCSATPGSPLASLPPPPAPPTVPPSASGG